MRMSVKLKFNDAQGKIVDQFSREIGLTVDEFCKRAVFYSINDSYKRADLIKQKLDEEKQNAVHNATTGNSGTDTQETHSSESTDSPALPDSADTNTNPET